MKPVLIVEGISDVNRLRNYIDCDFVITNGSAINKTTLDYIKELSHNRRLIVFTDPDYPGEKIRNTITQYVPSVEHCYIKKELASNGKKLGVCECDEQELKRALKEIIEFKYEKDNDLLKISDLIEFKLINYLDSAKRRNYVASKIPIGKTNGKTFLKRINLLGINKSKLKKWMEEYSDCK